MTDDLIAFLNARLDEDEAVARNATPAPWRATGEDILSNMDDPHWAGACAANASGSDAVHIARHDPARVLREVAAKRAILAGHEHVHRCDWGEHRGGEFGPCAQVATLAAIYSDHSDYPDEWKP